METKENTMALNGSNQEQNPRMKAPNFMLGVENPKPGITPGINPGASIDGIDESGIKVVCMADIEPLTEAELVEADGGYRRGFSHGVQMVADLLGGRMDEPTRKGIERISEIVLRLRFDCKPRPAFSDDVGAAFLRRKG